MFSPEDIEAFERENRIDAERSLHTTTVREVVNQGLEGDHYSEWLKCEDDIHRAISFDYRLHKLWNLKVTYNYKLKNSAGMAYRRYGDIWMSMHPGILDASVEEYIKTFLHELAHCAQYLTGVNDGHGLGWIVNMARLGQDPRENRRHSIKSCMRRSKK